MAVTQAEVLAAAEAVEAALDKLLGESERQTRSLHRRLVSALTAALSELAVKRGKLAGFGENQAALVALRGHVKDAFGARYETPLKEQIRALSVIDAIAADNFRALELSPEIVNPQLFTAFKARIFAEAQALSGTAQQRLAQAAYKAVVSELDFETLNRQVQGVVFRLPDIPGKALFDTTNLLYQDAVMDYYALAAEEKGKDLKIEHRLYYGDVIRSSRDWCIQYAGKIKMLDEWQRLWQNSDWSGKRDSSLISRGGYNCRHHFQLVRPEWVGGASEIEIQRAA